MSKSEVKIGEVAVDSGQLMICDPCYLNEYKNTEYPLDEPNPKEWTYDSVCRLTVDNPGYGQVNFSHGHPGLAVAFSSGYGDGTYEVFATIEDGRVVEVRIVMN
jgi:hypothetical protein